ncbi:MAG: hypothetical protein ACC662_04555 [Planctomycetota bacterium]
MCSRLVQVASVLLAGVLLPLGACGGGGGRSTPPVDEDGPFAPPLGRETRLDADAPGTALSVFPRIAGDGEVVAVVWYDARDGNTDIRLNRSKDGGRTWLGQTRRLDTDPPGSAGSNVPCIASDGAWIYVAWEDQREGRSEIRFNRSADAGSTWLDHDVRLDVGGAREGSSLELDIACEGPRVWVVWQDDRDGAEDIYLNRSEDGGTTWLGSARRLDTGDAAGVSASRRPQVAVEGDDVVVVWQDARGGEEDVRLNVSHDGGASWEAADLRLDTDGPGAAASTRPRLAMDGSRVAVVWEDVRDGAPDIRFQVSSDAGRSWLENDERIDTDAAGAAASRRPTLVVDGSSVFVAWQDDRAGLEDIRFNHSEDGGRTWETADRRLDRDPPGTARSIAPRIAGRGDALFVTWSDDREGSFRVLVSSSTDGGATFSDPEVGLGTGGGGDALAPDLLVAGREARVTFYDTRDGPGDVFYQRAGAARAP